MNRRLSTIALSAAALALLPSCSGSFDPASKVQSVRVLALRADKPYAKPGDTVSLEILAVDRRPKQDREMRVFWVPLVCTNPPNDAYFGCFTPRAQLTGPNGETGAPGGVGVGAGDVTSLLPKGKTFSYKVPANAVSAHPPVPGSLGPYGISLVFYMACAGNVRFASRDEASANPQQVPLLCVDDDGRPVGADDYVLGFWRTYVYDDRANANPVLEAVKVAGQPVDPAKETPIAVCARTSDRNCSAVKFDVVVPASSQEAKPYDPDAPKERVWVSAFSDLGEVSSAQRLLYDSQKGAVGENPIEVRAKTEDVGKTGTLWLIAHDNRSGASWTSLPIKAVSGP